jgi:hypothetical protein
MKAGSWDINVRQSLGQQRQIQFGLQNEGGPFRVSRQQFCDVLIRLGVVLDASDADASPLKRPGETHLAESQIFLTAQEQNVHFSKTNRTALPA